MSDIGVIEELKNSSFSLLQYKKFLHEFYGSRIEYKSEQFEWYRKQGNYIVVIAIVNGKIVGQATAYTCKAYISGSILPISWGCDTFVLPKYRGLGLGKKLQEYLHEHATNFSSAGYTPLNGIIKRKCGAHILFTDSFVYYPVSNLINFALKKIAQKKANINLRLPLCKFPFYYYLNKKRKKHFDIQIERYEEISDEVLSFMEHTLHSQYDFYIVRDKEYMQWKYLENPSMTYRLLTVRKNEKLLATIFFTDVFCSVLSGIRLHYCKVLDSIIAKDCGFTQLDSLLCVMKYWKAQHVYVDGIASLFDVCYWGKVGFKRPMLSMLHGVKVNSPYIAYSDQDLEQMR